MTHAEIYAAMRRLIPPELMEKYEHLSYADMADEEELAQWATALRWAEEKWTAANVREAVLS
jgi:hypothetical protein